jgi:exopolyphosphatase/guanosine-5'-triphosphate,3'-diphosphate pyrophosphatase
MLVDIGGGSTEIVLTEDGIQIDRASLQLGSVRLTEQTLGKNDPPTGEDLASARARARELIAERFTSPAPIDLGLAVAGTATTATAMALQLAEYDPERVHGYELSLADVESAIARCAAVPVDERRSLVGLEPDRAPVIIGGLSVLAAIFDHFGVASLTISECDILDGIALRAGERAVREDIRELPEVFGRTSC